MKTVEVLELQQREDAIQCELEALDKEIESALIAMGSAADWFKTRLIVRILARKIATLKVRVDQLEKGKSDVDDSDQGATEKRQDDDGGSDR